MKLAEILPICTIKFIFNKYKFILPYYTVAYILNFIIIHYLNKLYYKILLRDFVKAITNILQINMAGFSGYAVLTSTWYISATLLSMLILYPLCHKYGS